MDYSPKAWVPNATVKLDVSLSFSNELYSAFKPPLLAGVEQVCILVTAERDFDSKGYQHTPWDDQVSTLLTPAGLPIEGGGSGAVSRYDGYTQTTPVDVMVDVPIATFQNLNASLWWSGRTSANFTLPANLPPGIYRMRLDFGFKFSTRQG